MPCALEVLSNLMSPIVRRHLSLVWGDAPRSALHTNPSQSLENRVIGSMLKNHAFESSTPYQGYGGPFMFTAVSTQYCGGPQISLVTALVHHFAQPAHPERDRKGDAEISLGQESNST